MAFQGCSKQKDQRFWEIWRRSGSVPQILKNKPHPEAAPDEVFLNNMWTLTNMMSGTGKCCWKTARKGTLVCNGQGEITDASSQDRGGWFPVFVKREEILKAGIKPFNKWRVFQGIFDPLERQRPLKYSVI